MTGEEQSNAYGEEMSLVQPAHHSKPLLTVSQQVVYLKSKGVTFNLCSEEDAAEYLARSNNYLRTVSYRVLFPRQVDGCHVGDYIGLDFAHLMALSRIDRRLRSVLREITSDIEHFAKVRLLSMCEEHCEDGYAAVSSFLNSLSHADRNRLLGGLRMRAREGARRDAYLGDLIEHYIDDLPVWVFVETSELGAFVNFWLFCSRRWGDSHMEQQHYILKSVKALRDAVSHGSCIVNGFGRAGEMAEYKPNELITSSLNSLGVKNTKTRRLRLRNLRMAQMAATFYMSSELCTNPSTRARHAGAMGSVKAYYVSNAPLFRGNEGIVSSFEFLWRLVDAWLPMW